MSNPVRVLEKIQKIDIDIDAVRQERKGYAKKIAEADARIRGLERETEELMLGLEGLEGDIRAVEAKLSETTDKLGRDEERQGEIPSDKAQKALAKGINALRKLKRQAEEELKELNERAREEKGVIDKKTNELEEKRACSRAWCDEVEEKGAHWEGAIAEMEKQREAVAREVSPPILKKYHAIKERRGGVGVVAARDEICQGCFINIQPQVYIRLIQGTDELITCPHCHRILYFENPGNIETV